MVVGATGLGFFLSWEYLLKKQWGYSWVALFFTSHFQPLNFLKYLCNQSKLCLLNLLIILVRNWKSFNDQFHLASSLSIASSEMLLSSVELCLSLMMTTLCFCRSVLKTATLGFIWRVGACYWKFLMIVRNQASLFLGELIISEVAPWGTVLLEVYSNLSVSISSGFWHNLFLFDFSCEYVYI